MKMHFWHFKREQIHRPNICNTVQSTHGNIHVLSVTYFFFRIYYLSLCACIEFLVYLLVEPFRLVGVYVCICRAYLFTAIAKCAMCIRFKLNNSGSTHRAQTHLVYV